MLFAKMSVVDDVRSSERRTLSEETTIRLDNMPRNVGVFNLSATGCLIRADVTLEPGLDIRIGLPGVGAFDAEIVRSEGLEAGCKFTQSLTPQQLATAFQNDVVVDGNWMPEPTPAEWHSGDNDISPRAKLAYIAGLSGALWGFIALGLVIAFW